MNYPFFKNFIFSLSILFFFSCNSSNSNEPKIVKNTSVPETKAIFDVPSLVGKDIDEIRKKLGTPIDKEIDPSTIQKKMKVDFWDNTFNKNSQSLQVTFSPLNRKVTDFFIGTKDPSGLTSDYSDLLSVGNLKKESSNYIVVPVSTIKDKTKFTGIKIIVKNVN